MSAVRVTIDRVRLTLDGLPNAAALDIRAGLGEAIATRLSDGRAARLEEATTAALRLKPIVVDGPVDGAALNDLIAERIVDAMIGMAPPEEVS